MQPIVKHNFHQHVQFCEHQKPLGKNAGKQEETGTRKLARTQLNPFVVYAYLEAIIVASNEEGGNNSSNTIETERQYHASNDVGFYFVLNCFCLQFACHVSYLKKNLNLFLFQQS